MEKKILNNIGWIDMLRVIACCLVVISHCCDPFVGQFDSNKEAFLTGVFTGSFVRPCVPLFAMMTGVLLLPGSLGLADFYKKRIGRIVIPIVFWSITLPILFYAYFKYISPDTVNPSIVMADHTDVATLKKFYTFVFNFNFDTVPLWYLYMLIGLYLIMPVLGTWIRQASQKDLLVFLRVWGISLFLPYLKMLAPALGYAGNWGNMGILGICDWNEYGTFHYVAGFSGYLVLAYYLTKYPLEWSWTRMLSIGIPMFIIGYLVTSFGYLITQQHFPGNYAYLEIVWYFTGINVFMMTFPVFIIVQKLNIAPRVWLSKLASLTLGIYLCHFIIVQVAFDWLGGVTELPFIVRLLTMALVTLVISGCIAAALRAVPLTRKFVS